MSNMTGGCRNETLAKGDVARVERCADCGCVSIHLGPTTVRVCPGSLRSIAATLARAVQASEIEALAVPSSDRVRGVA